MSEATLIRVVFFASGMLLMGASIPMIRRRIAPNPIFGIRIPATFADEWVWYEANARSGRDLFIIGLGTCLLVVVLPLVPGFAEDDLPTILISALLVSTLVAVVTGVRYANRLLAEREAGGEELKPHSPLARHPFKAMRRQ